MADITVLRIIRPGLTGDGMDVAEAAALRADLAAYSAQLAAFGFDDLAGIDLTGLADGDVLIYDAGTSTWLPGEITNGVPVVRSDGTSINTNVLTLNFGAQFSTTVPGGSPTWVNIVPVWGGSGTAESFARSDHSHQLPNMAPLTFTASGSLSSGTRTLVSGTVSGLTSTSTYFVKASLRADVRGEGTGAGYTLPRITLNGVARDRFGGGSDGRVRTVSGVDRSFEMGHQGVTVTGVTSIAVSASIAYDSGDPVYIGGGELDITIRSNR